MNLKPEISQLQTNLSINTLNYKDYAVVRCGSPRSGFNFYYIDKQEIVGEGSFGMVYKAYFVDPVTGKRKKDKPFVAKVVLDKKKFDKREGEILKRYYPLTENPVFFGNQVILVAPFFAGSDLIYDNNLAPDIAALPFEDRANILLQLALSFNVLHHNKPSGPAVVHSDIKGENIRIFIDPKTHRINIYPVDFGLSTTLSHETKFALSKGGTLFFLAPEGRQGFAGTKTDVYALAGVFCFILGVKDPLVDKKNAYEKGQNYANVKYNYRELLRGKAAPKGYPSSLAQLMQAFLDRMQALDHEARAESDEVLHFTVALYNLCQIIKFDKTKKDINIEYAKLALLSLGVWNSKIGIREIKTWDATQNKEVVVQSDAPKTFAHFDYQNDPDFCDVIVKLFEKGWLLPETATVVATNENIKTILTFLNKNNLLTQELVEKTLNNTQEMLALYQNLSSNSLKCKKVGDLANKYSYTLSYAELQTMFAEKFNPDKALKVFLMKYIAAREADPRGDYYSFFGKHFGFSKQQKILAALSLMHYVDDNSQEIAEDSLAALSDHTLRDIVNECYKMEAKLPQELIEKGKFVVPTAPKSSSP